MFGSFDTKVRPADELRRQDAVKAQSATTAARCTDTKRHLGQIWGLVGRRSFRKRPGRKLEMGLGFWKYWIRFELFFAITSHDLKALFCSKNHGPSKKYIGRII